MPHCIVTSHPDYLKLLKESGLKEPILKAKISVWQEKTGNLDRFPTVAELNNLVSSPNISIKPGVSELFENNPELVNAVYEALGFETNKIKGIWGLPEGVSSLEKIFEKKVKEKGIAFSTAKELLEIISQTKDTLAPIAKSLIKYTDKILNANVEISKKYRDGRYIPQSSSYEEEDKGKILLQASGTFALNSKIIIHEIVHSFTSDFVRNNPNDESVLQLKNIIQELKKRGYKTVNYINDNNASNNEFYYFKNEREFIVGLFSDTEFI